MNKYIKLTCACITVSLAFTSCSGVSDFRLITPPVAAISTMPLPVRMPELSNLPFLNEDIHRINASIGQIADIDLTIPSKLNITRPDGKLTVTTAKYYIMGNSNPDEPVYFGDTEIQRLGDKGAFGVYVDLQMGDNSFKFSQGDVSQTVTITRKAFVPTENIPIKEIRQASIVPAVFAGVKAGGNLEVSCTAPSGASVTAYFDGKGAELKPSANRAAGLPVTYKGSIPVSADGYDEDITQNAGKVTYKLSYNGGTKTYESTGDVYVAGTNSVFAVKVKSYMGFVYPDLKNLSIFREKLKYGAVDYVKAQDNTYVELASGGYIMKEQLSVIEGEVNVRSKLGKVKFSQRVKGESFTFACSGKPAYVTRLSDGKFSLTFFNTTGASDVNVAGSSLFSSVELTQGETYATYTFTLKNNKLWGYNVNYGENSAVLSFQYKPVLGSEARPFEGMTIVIDPGHGGTDNGAIGFSGVKGPTETDVNLAHAYAVRDLLASMGANVVLTRSEDIYYSLDDRLKSLEEVKADIFVSIHHNSIAEGSDGNKAMGVEVYYHNGLSKTLAQSMMASVTDELGRPSRFVMQSYYRVTLSPYAPSILLELGFMSNPLEYERAANQGQISKAARAIANGIKRAIA